MLTRFTYLRRVTDSEQEEIPLRIYCTFKTFVVIPMVRSFLFFSEQRPVVDGFNQVLSPVVTTNKESFIKRVRTYVNGTLCFGTSPRLRSPERLVE